MHFRDPHFVKNRVFEMSFNLPSPESNDNFFAGVVTGNESLDISEHIRELGPNVLAFSSPLIANHADWHY